jgi:hypothetical protein
MFEHMSVLEITRLGSNLPIHDSLLHVLPQNDTQVQRSRNVRVVSKYCCVRGHVPKEAMYWPRERVESSDNNRCCGTATFQ